MDRGAIIEAILRHLARNPAAKDSVRGVVDWSRVATGVAPPETLVQEILDQLVREKRIAVSVLVDGTRLYHAPPATGQNDPTPA